MPDAIKVPEGWMIDPDQTGIYKAGQCVFDKTSGGRVEAVNGLCGRVLTEWSHRYVRVLAHVQEKLPEEEGLPNTAGLIIGDELDMCNCADTRKHFPKYVGKRVKITAIQDSKTIRIFGIYECKSWDVNCFKLPSSPSSQKSERVWSKESLEAAFPRGCGVKVLCAPKDEGACSWSPMMNSYVGKTLTCETSCYRWGDRILVQAGMKEFDENLIFDPNTLERVDVPQETEKANYTCQECRKPVVKYMHSSPLCDDCAKGVIADSLKHGQLKTPAEIKYDAERANIGPLDKPKPVMIVEVKTCADMMRQTRIETCEYQMRQWAAALMDEQRGVWNKHGRSLKENR